jgi:uncharacterized repeat protein (TIGR01451 family)
MNSVYRWRRWLNRRGIKSRASRNRSHLHFETLEARAVPAAFNPGDLVVLRAAGTTSAATQIFLDEYTPAGSLVQSISMPTAVSGSNRILTQSGSASSEGALNRSADGQYLTLVGYDASPGTTGVASGSASRVVGRVDVNGLIDTSTRVDGYSGNNIRSATTDDGTHFWTAGPVSTGGIHFVNLGASGATGSSVQVSAVNSRVVEIFGGQLYAATNSGANTGINTVGTGLPTTSGQTVTLLPGANDATPLAYVLFDRDPNVPGFDSLYVADQTSTTGLLKYSFNGTTWTPRGNVATTNGLTGLTAVLSGNNVVFYGTANTGAANKLVTFTDSAGYNAAISSGTFTNLATAPAGQTFKGVAFAPVTEPDLTVDVAGPAAAAVAAPFTYTLTARNIGPANATGVAVNFTVPAGLTVTGTSGAGFSESQQGNVVTFSGGSINAGGSASLTVTVTAASAATYTVPAWAAVIDPGNTIAEVNENNNNSPSTVSTLVTDQADLTVGLSAPASAYTNQPFTYTLTAANGGTASASGVTVQFTLPSSNLVVTQTSGAGFTESQNGQVVTFSDGTISAGGSASLTVSVTDPVVEVVTAAAGAAVIDPNNTVAESNENNNTNPSAVTTTIASPLQLTGVDVSPVVNQSFTGVVATFADATDTNASDFTNHVTITWGDSQTSAGVVAFTGSIVVKDINNNDVTVSLFTVTGTNTYGATGTYPVSVGITDANNNSGSVGLTARVGYAPLAVQGGSAISAVAGVPVSNAIVATFTDPGLVANLAGLGISDPTTQFSASINWGDSTTDTGSISYDSGTQVFSVTGSHTYTLTGSYPIAVAVTPLTLSVERTDSSDPTALNEVGDENGNGLTDSASADFIDQFVIGAANQAGALYTTSLPTVAAASGNEALTNSAYSRSEGELTLSTNGKYLVLGGYNSTVSLWAPQSTYSSASVVNRVIGRIDGQGNVDTSTALTDAYSGDNFRGVVSTDGTQFWTAGNAVGNSNFVHYAQYQVSTTTKVTGPSGPSNINTVEIVNGQLYEGVRSGAAGIYQIGTGVPTTAGQAQTLFIQVPQSNPLDVTDSNKPTSPVGFFMTALNNGNPTVNGVNVAYVADAEMGIARYDHTSSGWQFSYYIDSTGAFLDSAYTVDGNGNITPTGSFDPNDPDASADPGKAGGIRELTGRVVNGQVQLFAVTGFGTGSEPNPGGSLIEVNDTGAAAGFTTLAADSGVSATDAPVFAGVAFTPTATVSTAANVAVKMSVVSTQTVKALQNVSTGSTLLATFSVDGSPSLQTSDFGVTIDWKDGSALDSTHYSLSISGNQVQVFGTHTYTAGGSYSPVLTLTFKGSTSISANPAIHVGSDVTGSVSMTRTAPTLYTGATNTTLGYYHGDYRSTLTIKNTSGSAINGSLEILLAGLATNSPNVTLQYATVTVGGTLYNLAITLDSAGDPYVYIPKSIVSSLSAGSSLSIMLWYFEKTPSVVTYVPELFSDPVDN